MAKVKYSLKIGLRKSLMRLLVVGIPTVAVMGVDLMPGKVSNMTIAGVIGYLANLLVNYLKVKTEK